MRKYFGTDGIRGKVGQYPVTAEFMLKLGWAFGRVIASSGNGVVLIGKDTRISGYMFESALEAGLSSAGVDIRLMGPIPTPGVAYLTQTFHATAGIVISASHNPYYDNGVKFFSGHGKKLPDDVELAIELMLEKDMEVVESSKLGKADRIIDAVGRYIEFCKSTIPNHVNFSGMKMVLDCAHGATYQIAPAVFDEKGADITLIGVSPNGLNINDGYGSNHPKALQAAVLDSGADVGIAFDGDGDRVVMVDHKGEVVDGDEILYIIARSRYESHALKGGVVGTKMSNLGLEIALKELGIAFVRTNVGDRYVIEALTKNQWQIGGETSGHTICMDRTTTGDGIVSALQVLEAMKVSGSTLYELKSAMKKFPQKLVNVKIEKQVDIGAMPEVDRAVKSIENELGEEGRVLLRSSGTESVVRVMVEGKDARMVSKLADQLANEVKDIIAKDVVE